MFTYASAMRNPRTSRVCRASKNPRGGGLVYVRIVERAIERAPPIVQKRTHEVPSLRPAPARD